MSEGLVQFLRGHRVYCTARDGRFEEAADRIEQLEREQGWQDIATAPKDGTRLLLCSNWQYVCLGWWDGNERKEQGWFNALGDRLVQITHWRPLPEPPAIRSGDAG